MTAAIVAAELAGMGVQVVLSEPGRIRLVCDSGNVPAAAVELARSHKADLVELLSSADEPLEPAEDAAGLFCPSCRGHDLSDATDGLRCDGCGSLAFVAEGGSLTRVDMVRWFGDLVDSSGVVPMDYRTPPVESGRGPITCDKCDTDMARCNIEVNGWRNWDCPKCGHVHPRREAVR